MIASLLKAFVTTLYFYNCPFYQFSNLTEGPLASLLKTGVGMNIFRLLGDVSHLLAILILLTKIWKTRSCAGISGKSQILFLIVFVTRYLDLVTNFVSLYNTTMKVFFIASAAATVFLMYRKFKATYDGNHDSFRIELLLAPCLLLALVLNNEFSVMEILWTFSIYLESLAILPQLFMVSKTGEAETITSHYLFALGSYRALYILNWIYRYSLQPLPSCFSQYKLICLSVCLHVTISTSVGRGIVGVSPWK